MPPVRQPPAIACTGVVLAGGAGRRIGGDKALVPVAGEPLVTWPLRALRRVCRPVVVVARADTVLPPFASGAPDVWTEDVAAPRHPVTGIVHALRQADGPVLVCAGDLPLVDVATLRVILTAAALVPEAPVVVPEAGGHRQVLCALYRPASLATLSAAAADARLADLVDALGPAVVPFEDDVPFFNVNAPDDVARAEALLQRRFLSRT